MRKKNIVLAVIGVTITAVIVLFNTFKKDIWDTNADKLKNSFGMISGDAVIDNLSGFTPFEWDTLYSFKPYTPKEKVYETVGYKWDNISETVNEGMNQIVVTKEGRVVCYLYGYPERYNMYFDFGVFDGSFIKLTTNQKMVFKTKVDEKGIRYFEYIK
jgi:hypothetical protein